MKERRFRAVGLDCLLREYAAYSRSMNTIGDFQTGTVCVLRLPYFQEIKSLLMSLRECKRKKKKTTKFDSSLIMPSSSPTFMEALLWLGLAQGGVETHD